MMKLKEYFSLAEEAVAAHDQSGRTPSGLYGPIAYGLSGGGKRLRPVLLLLAAGAFGKDAHAAMAPAAGIEMFHNFTLLHDDVMDDSAMRRGRPSVYAKWGIDTAILSGDTMLTLATQLMAEVDDAILRRVLDVFNEMALKVYEGQQEDIEFEKEDDVRMGAYISMVEKKTGVLLGASAAIGAIIGGATEADARALYDFGLKMGVAFQIQDDWLDVFGDEETFGKPIGGDINNNKKTYLTISTLSCGGDISREFRKCMRLEPGENKIARVSHIYRQSGVSERCRAEISRYCDAALESLRKAAMSAEALARFEELVEMLIKRSR